MRIGVIIVALVLANPALGRQTAPPALSAPESLADVVGTPSIENGVETSRSWTLTDQQYAQTGLRMELDVRFGPTDVDQRDGSRISVWSASNPVHASEMRRTGLSRIVVVQDAATTRITVLAARRETATMTASIN